jgi:hypothetical protein
MRNLLQHCFLENVAAFPLATAIEAEGKTVTLQLSEIVNG